MYLVWTEVLVKGKTKSFLEQEMCINLVAVFHWTYTLVCYNLLNIKYN